MAASAAKSPASETDNKGTDKTCIICGEQASPKIVKDENFVKMMILYWDGLEVDIKPQHNKDYDLCTFCFYNLRQFYETHDICIYFAESYQVLRKKLLCHNLKGILKRQEDQIPLLDVHMKIQQKWGTKLEPEDTQNKLKGYNVNTYIVSDTPENEKTNPDNEETPTPSTSSSTREAASQPPQSKEKDNTINRTPQTAGKTKKSSNVRKSKRKRAKKSVWSSSSEDTTEELSTTDDDDSDF